MGLGPATWSEHLGHEMGPWVGFVALEREEGWGGGMTQEEEKGAWLDWLRKRIPPRPVEGFLDDIRTSLRTMEDHLRWAGLEEDLVRRITALSPEERHRILRLSAEEMGKVLEMDDEAARRGRLGLEARPRGGEEKEGPPNQPDLSRPHHIVWSHEFAKMVRRSGARLVVLTTCDAAHRDQMRFRWSSVAAALLRAGVPVVVGMQFAISDKAAIEFSKGFYKAVAQGLSVDEAVGHGREKLKVATKDSPLADFGLPVLYTRTKHLQAFEKVRYLATDTLPMTERFKKWNRGFRLYLDARRKQRGVE